MFRFVNELWFVLEGVLLVIAGSGFVIVESVEKRIPALALHLSLLSLKLLLIEFLSMRYGLQRLHRATIGHIPKMLSFFFSCGESFTSLLMILVEVFGATKVVRVVEIVLVVVKSQMVLLK